MNIFRERLQWIRTQLAKVKPIWQEIRDGDYWAGFWILGLFSMMAGGFGYKPNGFTDAGQLFYLLGFLVLIAKPRLQSLEGFFDRLFYTPQWAKKTIPTVFGWIFLILFFTASFFYLRWQIETANRVYWANYFFVLYLGIQSIRASLRFLWRAILSPFWYWSWRKSQKA